MTKNEIRLSVLKSMEAYCISSRMEYANLLLGCDTETEEIKCECYQEWHDMWKVYEENLTEAIEGLENE